MSSNPEVIRICDSINIDSGLIDTAKSECDALDLNITASSKTFLPGENCKKLIQSVKQQVRVLVFG